MMIKKTTIASGQTACITLASAIEEIHQYNLCMKEDIKTVLQQGGIIHTNFSTYQSYHRQANLPVFKISDAVITMAKTDVRYGKMPLYVTINSAGNPLSCCGDMETVQIPTETSNPYYVPVAVIEVL